MLRTLNRTDRFSALTMAVALTGAIIGVTAAPAPSQAAAAYYTATLAAPAEDNRAVAGGVAWNCKGTTCVAAKGTSRPMRICRGLAREFGEITKFTAKGKELAEDKLAKCNGK